MFLGGVFFFAFFLLYIEILKIATAAGGSAVDKREREDPSFTFNLESEPGLPELHRAVYILSLLFLGLANFFRISIF